MTKTKTLAGLAIMVGILATAAGPASAWFEAAKGTGGPGKAGQSEFTFGTAAIKCESAEFTWSVRALGTKPELTKQGQRWGLPFKTFNGCDVAGLSLTYNGALELRLTQPSKGETTGLTAEIVKGGIFKSLGCEIAIGTKGNQNLRTNSLSNSGGNLDANANDTGITEEAKGGSCAVEGIESGSKAQFKAPSLVGDGIKEI